MMTLGADVLDDSSDGDDMPSKKTKRGGGRRWSGGFVLTRLHARYGKDDMKNDLVFAVANPIVGGREFLQDNGKLEEGAREDSYNNFQGRYIIRHRWTGAIKCDNPRRNVWGGPPDGGHQIAASKPDGDLAFVKRNKVKLKSVVKQSIPELGIKIAKKKKKKKVKKADPPKPPKSGSILERDLPGAAPIGLGVAGALLVIGFAAARRRRVSR
jgi:hypothetical protein